MCYKQHKIKTGGVTMTKKFFATVFATLLTVSILGACGDAEGIDGGEMEEPVDMNEQVDM